MVWEGRGISVDARAEEAAGARHRVIRSAIRAPPKPGSDPSGLSFLAKYRMGRTERPRLAQTPDGPAKAILQPATSSRVLSPPRQVRLGPPSAELAGPGQGWRGRAGQLTPAHPSAPELRPQSTVAKSAPASRGGSRGERRLRARPLSTPTRAVTSRVSQRWETGLDELIFFLKMNFS